MNGVINVLKPPGMTSHDVVSFLRRELGEKRIGHAGTLDPQAAGVLPVCVGQATRLVEYLSDANKEYICQATFGLSTTTQDAWGEVVERREATNLTLAAIDEILPSFRGEITQITPAYSAVKRNGVPLYKLARQGKEVEAIPRQVQINNLRIIAFKAPVLSLLVECSKGTYIRALCHDLGQELGLGAHMSFLLRTRVGDFRLENSLTVEEISSLKERALLPLEYCVRDLAKITLSLEEIKCLRFGQSIKTDDILSKTESIVAVFDEGNRLQAIAEVRGSGPIYYLKPKKVINME